MNKIFLKIVYQDQVRFILEMQSCYNIQKLINVIHHINKIKHKNYMIISIDAEEAFDKIKHRFMMKIVSTVGIEEHN